MPDLHSKFASPEPSPGLFWVYIRQTADGTFYFSQTRDLHDACANIDWASAGRTPMTMPPRDWSTPSHTKRPMLLHQGRKVRRVIPEQKRAFVILAALV